MDSATLVTKQLSPLWFEWLVLAQSRGLGWGAGMQEPGIPDSESLAPHDNQVLEGCHFPQQPRHLERQLCKGNADASLMCTDISFISRGDMEPNVKWRMDTVIYFSFRTGQLESLASFYKPVISFYSTVSYISFCLGRQCLMEDDQINEF